MLRIVVPDEVEFHASADHHFNHKRIIEFSKRPFTSLHHMNSTMVRYHNELVQPGDYYFDCGDLALGDFQEALSFAAQLNGVKFLKPGNHDRISTPFRGGTLANRYGPMYESAGFTILPEVPVEVEHRGLVFELSHYPYSGDHTAHDRHTALRPKDRGLPLIHGHLHTERHIQGRMFNVGVDVNDFRPVAGEVIRQFVADWR